MNKCELGTTSSSLAGTARAIRRLGGASLAAAALLVSFGLSAQGLRPVPGASAGSRAPVATVNIGSAAAEVQSEAARNGDYIVAVVNSEPLTNSEVQKAVQKILQQLAQQRRPAPDKTEALNYALESLINEKAQLQLARETGIRVDAVAIDQAEQSVAQQNKFTLQQLYQSLQAEGITLAQFRESLRNQITLSRLREREVDAKVRVSDLEVNQFQTEQANSASALEINIAHILVAVPDNATPEQLAALQARAQAALARARAGEDFAALAREFSDAPDRSNGGQLGLRAAERYPTLFVEATQSQSEGAVPEVVKSGAGFHVLKLLEKRAVGTTVAQSHARHILLRGSDQVTETQARDRLIDLKRRVETGQAEFAALAREFSQDSSAAQGGDLGWSSAGQFVPEFESVMNALAPGQVSDPLISRFGVHLIQLLERRTGTLSAAEQQEVVRNHLREKKLDEAFLIWAKDLRGRTYVEMRDVPQ